MNFDKAIYFNNFLREAYNSLYKVIETKTIIYGNIDGESITFTNEDFDLSYYDFISELEQNCHEINDTDLIFEYVRYSFIDIIEWSGFEKNINQLIISSKFEIKYLLNLRENIDYYVETIKEMGTKDQDGEIKIDFMERMICYINHEKYNYTVKYYVPKTKRLYEYDKKVILNEGLFDFRNVLIFSEKFENLIDKINFFEDKLKNYIQLKNKKKLNEIEKVRLSQDKDFEKLCRIEIESLHRKLDLEIKTKNFHQKNNSNDLSDSIIKNELVWKSSATDLIELLTALYLNKSIERKDGQILTRKELMNFFLEIFDIQLKDPEGMLSRATNRKKMTPYLDKLKQAFENYADDKLEKQSKR